MMASSMNFMTSKAKALSTPIGLLNGVGESGLGRHDPYRLVVVRAAGGVLDFARDLGKQRVVSAHAHVRAGMHHGAALAHEDLSRIDALAAIGLNAQALGLGIPSVARTSARFLVCHAVTPGPRCRRCALRCTPGGALATSGSACAGAA